MPDSRHKNAINHGHQWKTNADQWWWWSWSVIHTVDSVCPDNSNGETVERERQTGRHGKTRAVITAQRYTKRHTCTRLHAHTRTHARLHARLHAHTHTPRASPHMRTREHASTYTTRACPPTRTRTRTRTHTCTHVHLHICTHMYTRTHARAYAHHAHTHPHERPHKRTRAHAPDVFAGAFEPGTAALFVLADHELVNCVCELNQQNDLHQDEYAGAVPRHLRCARGYGASVGTGQCVVVWDGE